jgi:membrane-associated phospholipid phosphatase
MRLQSVTRALAQGDRNALARVWAIAALLSVAVFAALPALDLRVAALFFDGQRFPLETAAPMVWARHRIWDASILLVLMALVGVTVGTATGRRGLWLPARVWGFVLGVYGLGVGVVTNLVLKEHWGRARPAHVEAFGGSRMFTGPFWPADQCAGNCSFVSGEASAAAALGLCLGVIAWHLRSRIGQRRMWQGMALGLAVALLGGLLRVMAGRHFLSDVVFAWLLVAGTGLLLAAVLRPARDPLDRVLTPPPIPPMSPATRQETPSDVALD